MKKMKKDQSFEKEDKEDTDRIMITIKTGNNNLDNRDYPQDNDQIIDLNTLMKKNKGLLLDIDSDSSPHEKPKSVKGKISSIKSPPKKSARERKDSNSFNLNLKYTDNAEKIDVRGIKKSRVIDYIEETYKINKKSSSPLPPLPKKQLAISLCLLTVGIVCILVGTIIAVSSGNSNRGIPFWIIGGLCGLPGMFYATKFCRACYAKTAESRVKALEDLPQD